MNQMMKNTALLGFSGFCAKGFDFLFRAFYSRALGQEGMGLLSLGFGIHGVMLTVSTAGMGMAVSKIVSGYLEKKDYASAKQSVKLSLYAVVSISLIVILFTYLGAEWIARHILGDVRVATSLCCLAPSILFMGISYCLKGYFYAERKVAIPASSEFLEQAVKGCLISLFLQFFLNKGIEYGCTAVFLGITLGELSSCVYLVCFYLYGQKNVSCEPIQTGIGRDLFRISFPTMLTSFLGSVLRMQEKVWIISALKRYGLGHGAAVSNLGMLHGMVMPLLVFPLTLIGSVSTLLVPEISRANAISNKARLQRITKKIHGFALLAGTTVFVIFQLFPVQISQIVYQDVSIVPMLRTLSVISPLMFLDSLSCSILNGMGKQFSLLCYSLSDSLLRLTFIFFLVPKFGLHAMVGIVIFSNLYTCFLTVNNVLYKQKLYSFFQYQKIERNRS